MGKAKLALIGVEAVVIAAPLYVPEVMQHFSPYLFWTGVVTFIVTMFWPFQKDHKDDRISIIQKMSGFLNINNNQNVNIGNLQRHIPKDFKENFSVIEKKLFKTNKFHIFCNYSDNEALTFAMEIKDFLISKGYEYTGFTSDNGIVGGNGDFGISYNEDRDSVDILVGANIRSDPDMKRMGGMMVGMGKI